MAPTDLSLTQTQLESSSAGAAQAIQNALESLENGGSLGLPSGEFRLSETITLPDQVTLRGAGRSTRLILDHDGPGVSGSGAQGIVVRDLSIDGNSTASTGIELAGCGDSQILDCYVKACTEYGVRVHANSFLCEIRGCKLAGNGTAGICMEQLAKGGRLGDFVPNLVTNCVAYGGLHGFLTRRAVVLNFVGCQAFQTSGCGFLITETSNSVLLSGCRTFKIIGDAVRVDGSHEIAITGNTFCWHRRTGIVLKDVDWGTISGNNVIDSGSEMTGGPNAVGIDLVGDTKGIQITGNAVFNWGGQGKMTVGIREAASCKHNSITNNNINWFEDAGVLANGSEGLVANNLEIQEPSYRGSPDGPEPRFELDEMESFIAEG